MRTSAEQHFDHSGGVQGATSWLLRAQNEIEDTDNGRFDDEIGRITRRNGYEKNGETLVTNKSGSGLHEAKFSTGAKTIAASNNTGDTATEIKAQDDTDGTWDNITLPEALPANMEINFADSLDELYVAGVDSSGVPMELINIKNDLSTSQTRNLIGAPQARFITEFGGALYAMNVKIGSDTYPNRAYRSSPALSVITYTRGEQQTNSTRVLNTDSARYLKVGMAIDIYDHKTDTIRYSNLTIAAVDKAEDSITLPVVSGGLTFTTANVNTTTDVITLSSTTNYPTGTPVSFTSTGSVPTGLVADVIYYVINTSGTTIKVAATEANATAGTAIDLTAAGSGTHSIHLSYYVQDNDEIYLTGRHGELCYLWNTDYPSADRADFLKIPSGSASNSAIVGYGVNNNRLFMFTDSSTHKWDQSQLTTVYKNIGCANHRTIVEIGDWLIWLDSESRVNARNDSTGQKEFVSRAIRKQILRHLPVSNYPVCAAGNVENIYKLHLGTIDGRILRVCYDFDSNNWTIETHKRNMLQHMISDKSGFTKLYFMDNTGQLFVDDEGDLDHTDTIPFRVRYGRNNSGTIETKDYSGYYIVGENMAGATVNVYVDGKPDPIELGRLTDNYSKVIVGNKNVRGRDISLEITHNGKGSPIAIEGYIPYLGSNEKHFG